MTGAAADASAVFNLPPIGEWVDRAACKGADPDIFMPVRGAFGVNVARRAAAYCDRCPVVAECDITAEASQHVGVWGGRLRRGRRHSVDLLEHLYDEWWWTKWRGDLTRAARERAARPQGNDAA